MTISTAAASGPARRRGGRAQAGTDCSCRCQCLSSPAGRLTAAPARARSFKISEVPVTAATVTAAATSRASDLHAARLSRQRAEPSLSVPVVQDLAAAAAAAACTRSGRRLSVGSRSQRPGRPHAVSGAQPAAAAAGTARQILQIPWQSARTRTCPNSSES